MNATKLNISVPKSCLGEGHGIIGADQLVRKLGFEKRRISLKEPSTKYCLSITGRLLQGMNIVTISPNLYVNDFAGPLESLQIFMPLKGELSHKTDGKTLIATSGRGFIFAPGQQVNLKWTADSQALLITISAEALSTYIEQQINQPLNIPLKFDNPLLSSISGSWLTVIEGLCEEINCDSSLLVKGLTTKNWQGLMISTILNSKQNSLMHFIDNSSCNAVPMYVKKTLHYIDTHLNEDIKREDLLNVSGSKLRTLHFGFRKYIGTSPMNYVKHAKLQQSRKDLLMNNPDSIRVRDIAIKWGINGSTFANEYKAMFGELPSQTLRNLNKSVQ